jgi:pyruvate/2-oxoglutarate dehydrogenase complex dihydrolipoamide dehydrogenase (E3) component
MPARLVIIGGGPGGNTAATNAARLGAQVTVIERDIVGGAAHLWDCIPSKTMIATGGAMSFTRRIEGMGLSHQDASLDVDAQRAGRRDRGPPQPAGDHPVAEPGGADHPRHRAAQGPHEVVAETEHGIEEIDADAILIATGSRPRIPDWAEPDGDRILTTRQAYPPRTMPEHLVVIGSGVTGVEFVHMFSSFGAR